MSEFFKALAAPFPPEKISWRIGSTTKDKSRGMALAYIDARDVMERLDDVVGPGGWQNRYPHANGKTVCEIGINLFRGKGQVVEGAVVPIEQWVWKSDGAGDSDVEAEKGALSDAFKRAAVRWGIGRYLYDLASPWVALEAAGNSYKIAPGEYAKLRALLSNNAAADDETVSRGSKDTYIRTVEVMIESFTTVKAMTDWWNSEDQKKARRDFDLDASEVAALKNRLITQKANIEKREAA